jgi:hypothetical protein
MKASHFSRNAHRAAVGNSPLPKEPPMPNELAIPTQTAPIDSALAKVLEGLSVPQALAMDTLMRGGSITAAATTADVSRQTLYNWLEPGQPLHTALTLWKQDLATTARTRLLMMTDIATSNVMTALTRGDHRTALTLLQKIGVLSAPPIGPTHIEAATAQTQSRTEATDRQNESHRKASAFMDEWDKLNALEDRQKSQPKNKRGPKHAPRRRTQRRTQPTPPNNPV